MDAGEAYRRAEKLDKDALYYAYRCRQEITDLGGETEYSRMLYELSRHRTQMATSLRLQATDPPQPWELLDKVRDLQGAI